MLPGLEELLNSVPKRQRTGWVVNPLPIERDRKPNVEWFRPADGDLKRIVEQFSNSSVAEACNVSEASVRKWLKTLGERKTDPICGGINGGGNEEAPQLTTKELQKLTSLLEML